MSLVTYADVVSAAAQIAPVAHRTPVITSHTLDERVGANVFLKCENLQRMGAFKFRGAYNAMSRLSDAEKARGVITFSSGNHAQAIALSGKLLGVKTVVVMPDNAPIIKREATKGYGAEVVQYNPSEADRKVLAEDLAKKYGYTIIPPFDHPHVIAGQGTSALELIQDVGELDTLLVCVGGGGLLSGCAIAARGASPKCKVIGIEPEIAADATESFRSKKLTTIPYPHTIADGTRTVSLGDITFPLILDNVDDFATVSEQAIKAAVRFAFFRLKLVMEPSGVLGLAALLSGAVKATGKVGVIISGGNIDAPTMSLILSESDAND
ncbi:MAG: threo-3-hydroxy-L-aspartate ammonia-lyase [Anaerolineae bacterium]|nr:threo-3-hydroxy-L-aspartate ammonia-lyase [Anaerolineae bacterium]